MTILPTALCRSNTIPCENLNLILHSNTKTILQFTWNHNEPLIPKTSLNKKNNVGGTNILDFKTDYRDIVIKANMVQTQKQT